MGTDSLSGESRAAFNLRAISDSTQNAFVSDPCKCTRAAIPHAAAQKGDTLNPSPVYLLGGRFHHSAVRHPCNQRISRGPDSSVALSSSTP
jgi:hypothetical protein